MKKYINPEIELITVNVDIVTASGGDGFGLDGFDINNPPSFD